MTNILSSSEWELCRLRRAKQITYVDGASTFERLPDTAAVSVATDTLLQHLRDHVLGPLGSTGVLAAMTQAVHLRIPRIVYPVDDLTTCIAVHVGGIQRPGADISGKNSHVAAEAVLLHPGSTPETLFNVLLRPPFTSLSGDFVRAEGWTESSGRQLLRKDEVLGPDIVCRVMTNRKVSWQRKQPQASA